MRVCLSIKFPWPKQKRKEEKGKRESEQKKKKERQKKKSSAGHPSWWKCVCVCVCIPYSFCSSDTRICDTNDVQLWTSVIASLSHRRQCSTKISSRDRILELLTDWCVWLVAIVCSAFRFQFMRHLMCACVCMPYVNLLDIRVCLIYHQHHHHHHHHRVGCWCLPQLVFVVVVVVRSLVRSFASMSITLQCEVLRVCQE